MKDVAIIGSRITGNLAAAYLRREHPDLKIIVVDYKRPTLPIVGESCTEFSTQFFHRIGLTSYLEREHFPKYGLTFYFKKEIENPADRTYSVHEAPACPPLLRIN